MIIHVSQSAKLREAVSLQDLQILIRIRYKKCNIAVSCHCERSEAISLWWLTRLLRHFTPDIDVTKIIANRYKSLSAGFFRVHDSCNDV